MQYYRTKGGLYYVMYNNGTKRRISEKLYLSKVQNVSKSRRTRSKSRSNSRSKCKNYLSKKIAQNMKEYEMGKFSNRKQVIAISYSQTKQKYPNCSIFH